jgi:hypothetical protein
LLSRRRVAGALFGLAALAAPAFAQPPAQSQLPDWSGAWVRATGGFYESRADQAMGPQPPADSTRRHPPYTPKFQAIYEDNLKRIAADRYPDPISICGTPAGWPRLLGTPDAYEFIVRPEQTWIISENGPNIIRIYTDGRGHPPDDELWPTYTGHSVGQWKDGVLTFHTKALKGVGHTILGRAGVVMSDKLEVTTRIRLIEKDRLLVELLLEDAEALTRPWPVAFTFTRLPPGSTVWDYACAENNRNPVTATGQTLTLDAKGEVLDRDR